MAWTFDQQVRLQQERQIIEKYLRAYNPTWVRQTEPGYAYIEVRMKTNAGNIYKLQLFLPKDLPNSVPRIYIVEPHPLLDYRGNDLSLIGYSAIMHTLTPANGCVQICHYRGTNWTPNVTLYKVFMKARLWLEAYEIHRKTGQNLDIFLRHQ